MPMTAVTHLVVVTHRRWLADDLAAAAPADVAVVHSLGLDVPTYPGPVAWWAPTEWAARALRAGADLTLTAPGPGWLATVPERLLGRPVWAGTLADLDQAPGRGWCKPAEIKVQAVPAAWLDHTRDFAAACAGAGLGPDTWVQVSPLHLDVVEEYRVYILSRSPVAASIYLRDGAVWQPEMTGRRTHEALEFAAEVTGILGENQPDAYVLDVAHTRDGQWFVLEGNPAWSAAPYGCDPNAVIAVLLAANQPERRWQWRPDPWLVSRAGRQRRLDLSPPP